MVFELFRQSHRPVKISSTERTRVLDYLVFKLKHGGNIMVALRSYMEGNRAKSSLPVRAMLERMEAGEGFAEAALAHGLVDRYGYLVLSSGIEASKSIPVVRDTNIKANFGVTAIIIRDVLMKWGWSLALGLTLWSDAGRGPILKVFNSMNDVAAQAGGKPLELPSYLGNHWLVLSWVLAIGTILVGLGAYGWWLNRYHTNKIYQFAKFRFYEDWSSLLALYVAFKASGQSDLKAAQSLAQSCAEGSFNRRLFDAVAESMRSKGKNFYDVLAEYEHAIPTEVLSFFMDASKTGQFTSYISQAKAFCDERLEKTIIKAKAWVPAITGVIMAMAFGLMVADLFVKLTMLTMKPMMG